METDAPAEDRRALEAECLRQALENESPGGTGPVQPTPRTVQIQALQQELAELKQGPVFRFQAAVVSVQNATATAYAESVAPALETATTACSDAANTVSTKIGDLAEKHEPDLAIASARIGGALEQLAEAAAPAAASAGEFLSQASAPLVSPGVLREHRVDSDSCDSCDIGCAQGWRGGVCGRRVCAGWAGASQGGDCPGCGEHHRISRHLLPPPSTRMLMNRLMQPLS